jgi:hypothetical protein
MAKEEISFVLNSNLDKIADHAKILSQNVEDLHQAFKRKNAALIEQNKLESVAVEGIKKLADNYSKLSDSVSGVINNNKNFVDSFSSSASNLSALDSVMEKFNNRLSSVSDGIETAGNNWKRVGPNTWQMNDPSSSLEGYWSTIKKIGNFIHDIVKSVLDGIHKMGAQLAIEAVNLKPFALDFMSSFSFNPLKFFGFGEAMKQSFDLILKFQQMRHELAYLSDASGDASKALSLVYEIAGGSAVASGTAQGIIRALADQGIIANKELKSLGILSGNLQAATGIAASQWASFTGELAFNYGIPIDGLENITSALIGTNIRGAQLEKVMGTVNKVLQTTGFIAGVPTTESVHKLTKSIGGASKTFQALGISAEKSGAFIEGIMDPENFEKNAFMFAKLGISASEYAGYLNDADGQQKLLQKTMQNLPALANEIANIQNPFARMQYAKTIGLDMQIVQRMAGKTKAEIEDILSNYEKENKAKEALEAKKQKMAAEAAKFDDMMLALKLKVLAPVMNFLSSGYLDRFFSVLPKIAETIGSIFKAMTPIIEKVTGVILDAMPYVTKLVDDWLIPFINMFPQMVKSFLGLVGINETSTEANMAKILEYLGIAAGVLAGWKAFTFIGDMVGKVIEFVNPKSKKIMTATVGDLASAIGDEVNRGPIGGGGGLTTMISSVLLAMVGMGIGSLIFKHFFGEKSKEEFNNLANFGSERGMERVKSEDYTNMFKGAGEKTFMAAGGLGITGGKLLYDSSKISMSTANEALAAKIAQTAAMEQTMTLGEQSALAGGAFKSTLSKELAKNVTKKVVAPVGIALAGLDWYNVLTSDKQGMSKYLEVAAAGLNTYAAYSIVSGLAMSATGVGALPGAGTATTGVVAGITAGALNVASTLLDANDKREAKKARYEQLYSPETRKLAEQAGNDERSRDLEVSGGIFSDTETFTLKRTSSLIADTFEEFQKRQEEDAMKAFEATGNTLFKRNRDAYNSFVKDTYGKDEETYLKERLGLAMLTNDIDTIEANRNVLREKLNKDGLSNAEAEAKIDKIVGETLEQTKAKINERMDFAGQEINKISDIFGGLVKAFKLGDFDKIGQVLGAVFLKIKLGLIELISDVAGSGTGYKVAKSFFGEGFAPKGIDDYGYVADKEWGALLKQKRFDSDVALKEILMDVNKSYGAKEEQDRIDSEKAAKQREQMIKNQKIGNKIAADAASKDTGASTNVNIDNFNFGKTVEMLYGN